MAADQGARLGRLRIRRADHEHDRGRERDHGQRIVRGGRKQLHAADCERSAKAGDRAGKHVAMVITGNRVAGGAPPTFHAQPLPSVAAK